MKIFEYFITEPNETKQDVIEYCFMHRLTPCVINDENEFLTDKKMQKLCDEGNDCEKCLEKYLDIEIGREKKEDVILDNQVKMEV